MKYIHRLTRLNPLLLASVCVTCFALSACSEINTNSEKLSETQACNNLKDLIADHPNQFKSIRATSTANKRLNIWSAQKAFPSAENCQVWEWSTGLFNYACEWSTGNDENQAVSNYQNGVNSIQACLGDAWTAQSTTTQSGGKHTLYSTPDTNTIVSIRYFKEQKGWSPSWQNSIIIGDKSNLKATVQ